MARDGSGHGSRATPVRSAACTRRRCHANRSVRCSWSRSPRGRSSWPGPTSRSSARTPSPGCSRPFSTARMSATSCACTATASSWPSPRTTRRSRQFSPSSEVFEAYNEMPVGELAEDLERASAAARNHRAEPAGRPVGPHARTRRRQRRRVHVHRSRAGLLRAPRGASPPARRRRHAARRRSIRVARVFDGEKVLVTGVDG